MSEASILAPTTDRELERSNWDLLSLLRFVLALIVALSHLEFYSPHLGPLRWIENPGSFEAILGFLLISGYSIGHSLQKQPRGFLRRRMFRIYPVYFAAMILTYAVERNPLDASFAWGLLLNLFFLGQVVVRYSYVDAAWSLGLEVWLYCLAPLLIRLRALFLELLIGLSFLCYIYYTCGRSLFHLPHYAGTMAGINLPCLAFIWIAGFYLSTAPAKVRPFFIIGALFLGHLILTSGIQGLSRFRHHDLHGFFVTDLSSLLCQGLLLAIIFLIFRGILFQPFHFPLGPRRVFRFLGDISYPLYLVHIPAFRIFTPYSRNAFLLLFAAVAISTVVYLCCDFYSLRRKLM